MEREKFSDTESEKPKIKLKQRYINFAINKRMSGKKFQINCFLTTYG